MFAVAFEVLPHSDTKQEYLDTAKELRSTLEGIDGFREIDRFGSRMRPGWILSLSFWKDEASLVRWRSQEKHYLAQLEGRRRIFGDYRIRVAQVIADDDFGRAVSILERRSPYRASSISAPKLISFVEAEQGCELVRLPEMERGEIYDSFYHPGKALRLQEHDSEQEIEALRHRLHIAGVSTLMGVRLRAANVERDYRLRLRDEAPQFMVNP